MSALIAYLHSLSMIALGSLLVLQLLSFDRLHEKQELHRFFLLCVGIAAAAALMLLSGLGLLLWSEHGGMFYLRNPVFYIKIALFAAMLLIAITPTRIVLQWRRQAESMVVTDLRGLVKRYVIAELILFALVPLAAALSARGIGFQTSSI
ncbi:MAG: DUF2214 family protein [Burkholderiales bacterium]|nr:DUF2214 family protein [Burkholderiales bacterium]